MIGVSYINTVEDIANNMKVDKEATKEMLINILDDRFIWVDKGVIEKDSGVEDDTHRVIETKPMGSDDIEYHQLVREEDPNSRLVRLGLTVSKVNKMLKS